MSRSFQAISRRGLWLHCRASHCRGMIAATLLLATIWWAGQIAAEDQAAAGTPPLTTNPSDDGTEPAVEQVFTVVNEQLLLWATIITAITTLPPLVDFLVDRRKRKERIALSIDDVEVSSLQPRLAGMDAVLASIADLIDRCKSPAAYADLKVGNEMLIIGGSLSGKKTLAQKIAKEAGVDRLITVYNPRNPDALARAKSMVQQSRREKVMLLLPRIDTVFEKEDDDLLAELEALVETASELTHVIVVGTANTFVADSPLDNLFGIKLVLPGTPTEDAKDRTQSPEARKLLEDVARYYLDRLTAAGFVLEHMDDKAFIERVLTVVSNPAEIEDIAVLCQTSAVFAKRVGVSQGKEVNPAVLQKSIGRVIVGTVGGD